MKSNSSILCIGLASVCMLGPECPAAGALRAVSALDRTNSTGMGGSFTPSFSGNGRFVVFVGYANNLVTNDNLAPYLDVFVRDLTTSNTILVSVNMTGIGGGNDDANYPSISSNGQFVAFASAANNLAQGVTNKASDIFVRDLVSATTTLVSSDATATRSGNGPSSNPRMTPDGRWVVFESAATDLVTNDTNQIRDLFVRDRQSGTTFLVSVGAQKSSFWPKGSSHSPAITPDGNRIAFVSTAANLIPNVTNEFGEIYVRDRQMGVTLWASTNVSNYFAGSSNGYACFNPAIAADGRFVTFKASPPGATNGILLFYHDLQAGASTLLASDTVKSSWPAISADGRLVAAEDSGNVYVWDTQAGSTNLISLSGSSSGPANGISHTPVMSPDGSSLVFLSTATDLVTNATFSASSGFQLYARDLAAATTRLVSVNLNGAASESDLGGIVPAISDDGKRVTFDSSDENLVAGDMNRASDVFVRDLAAGTTELVSARHSSLPALTGLLSSGSATNSISADGRYVVFASLDNVWVSGDTNGFQDLFERDLLTGTVIPISLGTNGLFRTDGRQAVLPATSTNGQFVAFVWRTNDLFLLQSPSDEVFWRDVRNAVTVPFGVAGTTPAISPDGHLVAFQTGSLPLVQGQVYLRDMKTGTLQLASGGNAPVHQGGYNPMFSPDGRWLLFASYLSSGVLAWLANDLTGLEPIVVITGPGGGNFWNVSGPPVFSANSRFLAFGTANQTSVPAQSAITLFDFASRSTKPVCTNCGNPSISGDGRFVVYETPDPLYPYYLVKEVVLKDLQTGATELISVNRLGTGGGNRTSASPLISRDGRFVVFASKASDLVENDNNNASDIFVRDRLQGRTLLVSLNKEATGSGNGSSTKPVMAADGRTVIFQSLASDLVPGDYNDKRDVFVLRLAEGELRVLTLTSVGSGTTTVLWSAVPGKSYQVQFKNEIDDPNWTTLPSIIAANGTTAAAVDNSGSFPSHRFYRVMLVP